MSTRNRSRHTDRVERWTVPALGVVFGVVLLVIGLANGRTGFGVTGLVVMAVYAAGVVLLRRRSEPAALLSGDTSDERRVAIQLKAGALTGSVLIVVIVAGWFWSLATDNRYVGVFSTLAAVGGLTLMGSTIWYSRRS